MQRADAILEGQQIGTEGGTAIVSQESEESVEDDSIDIAATLAKAGLSDPDEEGDVDDEAVSVEMEATAETAEETAAEAVETPAEGATEESNEASAS